MAVLEVVGGNLGRWWTWLRRLRRSNDDDGQKLDIFVSLRGLVASKPRTNERQREKDNDQDQRKKGRWAWGMQWLKWSERNVSFISSINWQSAICNQLAEIAQYLGGGWGQRSPESHKRDAWRTLRRGCFHRSATLTLQLICNSFGQIRRKQNAMISYEISAKKYEPCQYMNLE